MNLVDQNKPRLINKRLAPRRLCPRGERTPVRPQGGRGKSRDFSRSSFTVFFGREKPRWPKFWLQCTSNTQIISKILTSPGIFRRDLLNTNGASDRRSPPALRKTSWTSAGVIRFDWAPCRPARSSSLFSRTMSTSHSALSQPVASNQITVQLLKHIKTPPVSRAPVTKPSRRPFVMDIPACECCAFCFGIQNR